MKHDAAIVEVEKRSPVGGLLQIVQFNWPQYAVGFATVGAAVLVLILLPLPLMVRWAILAGIAAAAWWLLASLAASYWIYDLSGLTAWTWLRSHLPSESAGFSVINVHSGFDDTTGRLRDVFSDADVQAVDLYDPRRMTEPSIHRARRAYPPLPGTLAATPEEVPLEDGTADAVLLLLAAHELRQPAERAALFREVHRALKPGGSAVVVEHARNGWNFLAFGPGFLHFLPFAEWRRVARAAGLRTVQEGRVTPFVRYLVLES